MLTNEILRSIIEYILSIVLMIPAMCSYNKIHSLTLNVSTLTTAPVFSRSSINLSIYGKQSRARSDKNLLTTQQKSEGCRLGIDTHADSSCAGKHVRILEFIDGKRYNVTPFHDSYRPQENIGLVNGIVAVDKENGEGYILELNNFLDFTKDMEHSILVPMQARMNGVVINDIPINLCPYSTSTQSMILPDKKVEIPIEFHGPIPYIRVRYPTDDDMENYHWMELTSKEEWKPYELLEKGVAGLNLTNDLDTMSGEKDSHNSFIDSIDNHIVVYAIKMNETKNTLTAEKLSKMWRIPLLTAKRTIEGTTHRLIRTNEGHLSRRFRTDTHARRYNRLGGPYARFYTDTLFFKLRTVSQFSCAQIYSNRIGYTKLYPMVNKSQAHESLSTFIHEVGIPHEIHCDEAKELISGEMKKKMIKYEIHNTWAESYSPWQNSAEDSIRVIKSWARYFMQLKNTPLRLCDHAMLYATELRNITVPKHVRNEGRTPFEIMHGYTPDISEYATFEWYEPVWYWDPVNIQKQKLGRWLGVSNHIGTGHVYKILTIKASVIARSTVNPLSADELSRLEIQEQIKDFDQNIKSLIGNYNEVKLKGENIDDQYPFTDFLVDDQELQNEESNILFQQTLENGETYEMPHSDNDQFDDAVRNELKITNDALAEELRDRYIGVKVNLPYGDHERHAVVKRRKRTYDGKELIGTMNANPLLDTRLYEVEFPDGGVGEYTANVIAESIYSNVDEEGNPYALVDGIIGHRCNDEAVKPEGGYINVNNSKKRVITTKGWDILVQWRDGTTSWLPLKDIKSSHPLELAEYAISRRLDHLPAFAWWIPTVIRTRRRMISRLKSSRRTKKHIKFGVVIPQSWEECLALDRENGNDLWQRATEKEIGKVRVAFTLLTGDEKPPIGSKEINYHIIWDCKMDLTRKARLVAGGHLNKLVPKHITYSSVVSRESVRICFLIAAMNDLDVLSGDIGNAYLNAKPREKCHVKIEHDFMFGPEAVGSYAVISRALYGMKSSGAAWRDTISTLMRNTLGFNQCYADNDVWYKKDTNDNGIEYYSYICIYVDDILIISRRCKEYMSMINEAFMIKPESIKTPDTYLGADVKQKKTQDGTRIWILGSNSYLKEALRVYNGILADNGLKVYGKGLNPFSNVQYKTELDLSNYCNEDQIQLFQNLIGILRWLIELGRVDILVEVSQLSSYLAGPRVGHLNQCFHIFHYLSKHNNSWLPMDPMKLDIQWTGPPDQTPNERRVMMKKIYPDAQEDIPLNAPKPHGKSVQINVYCDANHAGNQVTRRSQSGILIYLNTAPISFYSKRQNSVESSTFGSEFVALRIATEKIKALRYKLRMMGVPLDGPANVFVDNESVVGSSMRPESVLKKKHVSIAYNIVREAFAASIINVYFVPSTENLADAFTKVLPIHKRKPIFDSIFW